MQQTILLICSIALPALAVIGIAYLLLKQFLTNESEKRAHEIKARTMDKVFPLRIQAYERYTLYLERISPNNLVMRVHKPGMNASLMHGELLRTIRQEFDHNLAQQIYISSKGWELIKNAKEETIKVVNLASTKVENNGDSYALSRSILEIEARLENSPVAPALEYLKKEVAKNFY